MILAIEQICRHLLLACFLTQSENKKKHGSLEGELICSYWQTGHRKYLSIGISDVSDTNHIADIGFLKVDIISLGISNSPSILPTYLVANVCRS